MEAAAYQEDWLDSYAAPAVAMALQHFREGPRADACLLDVGCGNAHRTASLLELTPRITGLDKNPEMIAVARARLPALEFVESAAECMPLPDCAFDYLFAFSTMQYTERAQALHECVRVLKNDGRAAFVENLQSSLMGRAYRACHRLMGWSYLPDMTPKEHLKWQDLGMYERYFKRVSYTPLHLLSPVLLAGTEIRQRLLGSGLRAPRQSHYETLNRIDQSLLRKAAWLRRWCLMVVVLAERPRKPPTS